MKVNMETLSLKQAADATGKNKTTILKAINKGTVIAEKNEKGEWKVNIASLSQSYKVDPDKIEKKTTVNGQRTAENATSVNTEVNTNSTHEIIELRAELKFKNELLKERDSTIQQLRQNEQELKTEKTRFVDMLEKKDNLLTFYQEKEVEQKPEPIPPTPKTDLRPFWALLVALIMGVAIWYNLSNKNVSETLKIENQNTPVQETPPQQ